MRKILIILTVLILPLQGFSQYYENKEKEKEKASLMDRIYFGGYLGLQFGTYTLIDISPLVGYKITPKFHAGLRFTYQYSKTDYYGSSYESSSYGGSVFTRFYIIKNLYAQAEAEYLNIEYLDQNLQKTRMWIDSYYIGGGYFQPFGKRGGMYFTILWNLNQNQFSPYDNPVMRIGFTF